jgi:hypothetical protein
MCAHKKTFPTNQEGVSYLFLKPHKTTFINTGAHNNVLFGIIPSQCLFLILRITACSSGQQKSAAITRGSCFVPYKTI